MNLAQQLINGLVLASGYACVAIGWTVLEDLLIPTTGLDKAGEAESEAALERAVVALIDCYTSEWRQQTRQPRAT